MGLKRREPDFEKSICEEPLRFFDHTPRDLRARTLRGEAHHHIRLDFIFRLRIGLTPSPTNGCKSAAFAPPSRRPSQGENHDQSRRYSDVLLRQRVLCGSCSRGHNSACLTCARAAVHAQHLPPSRTALRPLLHCGPSILSEPCVHCLQVPRLHDHLFADQIDQTS